MRARLRELSTSVAIYGAGDVAVQIAGFVLLPIYIKGGHLGAADFGALAWLIGLEALWKITARWGLDGAFMRFYLDASAPADRQSLASTLLGFQAVATSGLLAVALALSAPLADVVFGDLAGRYLPALRLMLVNTFLVSFTYVPFHLLRMEKRALAFSALTFARSVTTLVLRIALVVGAGWGVTGLMLADLAATILLGPWLVALATPLVAARFDQALLARALRFGLPRLPHGLAQQALDAGNAMLFGSHATLADLGVYNIGGTIARGLKLFLSAFETGWAPFYYHTAREEDAKTTFGKVTTYGVAVLVGLLAVVTVVAEDLVRVLATETYASAALVVPLIALGVVCQGIYLLTSIGLNLTGRTEYYPLSTFAAAAMGLGSGLVLMPRWGAVGAATSFVLAYATLAAVAFAWAQRVYPMRYELGRLAKIAAAGLVALTTSVLPGTGQPWIDLGWRAALAAAVFAVALISMRFLRQTEWSAIGQALGARRS